MAKVLTDEDDMTHLRNVNGGTLCGRGVEYWPESDGILNCPDCAAIALCAVELVTKAEKREWRKL